MSRRTISKTDNTINLKSSLVKDSGLWNNRENITSSVDDLDISSLDDRNISWENPNIIAKHNIARKDILVRRVRNTRSKATTDLPMDSDAIGMKEASSTNEVSVSDVDLTKHDIPNSINTIGLRRNQRQLSKGTFGTLSSEGEDESLNNSQTLHNSSSSKNLKTKQHHSAAEIYQTHRTGISMSLEESNTETNGESLKKGREIGSASFQKRQKNKDQVAREKYQEELRKIMPTNMSETCLSNITDKNASKGTLLSIPDQSLHHSAKYPLEESRVSVHETIPETTKIQEHVNRSGVAVSKRDYQHRRSLNSPKPTEVPINAADAYPPKSNSMQQNTTANSPELEPPQHVEMDASAPLISNDMSPKSIYNSPLSNTMRLENDSTQVSKL